MNRALPLAGVRVLDFGQMVLGPYAGFLLAMAGAEVIKIEPPRGEPVRAAGETMAYMFNLLNARKMSVAIDLKTGEGRALVRALAAKADILLENFAPGVMDRLGVGAAVLMADNPRLVYASASGFGADGERSDMVAMDSSIQAMAGVTAATGEPEGPPLRAGLPVADFVSGTAFYGAIVTALLDARATGAARRVDLAMLEALFPLQAVVMNDWYACGRTLPPRYGNGHPLSIPQGAYAARDGWLFIQCGTDAHWRAIVALACPGLADDPAYVAIADRARHREEIDRRISAWIAARGRAEILAALQRGRVPASPIRDVTELLDDGPLRARGFLHDVAHPVLGEVPMFGSPLRFKDSEGLIPCPAPNLGEHDEKVLAEILGLSQGEIERLRAAGAIL